jgi:hypothetical protein
MKNILLLLPIFIGLSSCGQSKEDIVIEHVRQTLKNPDSFELDSIIFRDTITQWHSNNIDVQWGLEDLEREKNHLDFMMTLNYVYSIGEKQEQLNKVKKMGEDLKVKVDKLDQMKGSDQDTVLGYTYTLYFKGTNSFGAVVKDQTTVMIDYKNKVVTVGSQLGY